MADKQKVTFKEGDRVVHKSCGLGTVTVATYNTIHMTTWTCVRYDDFLGIKDSLCGETSELTLAKE
jgi:hypothetical protein